MCRLHYFYCSLLLILPWLISCRPSATDYAIKWTNDIKQNILIDANRQPDKSTYDSARYIVTLYNGNNKLKKFNLYPKFDSFHRIISMDTVASTFYSMDQNFKLVRELCPLIIRSFEGIQYNDMAMGLAEFKFCDGKIKKRGFRYRDSLIGIWTTYDSTGKVIEEKDYGNVKLLYKLEDLKS